MMSAQLEGAILENSMRGLSPGLEHVIKATLPGGRLTISSLRLGVRSWKELQERRFTFSAEPRIHMEDGEEIASYEVDGALQRLDGLQLVRVTGLALGRAEGLLLPAVLSVLIDDQPSELSLMLEVGAVTVYGDLGSSQRPDVAQATALAQRFLTLEDYRLDATGKHVRFEPTEKSE